MSSASSSGESSQITQIELNSPPSSSALTFSDIDSISLFSQTQNELQNKLSISESPSEQTSFLEKYFSNLSQFSFERTKEIADREKDYTIKNTQTLLKENSAHYISDLVNLTGILSHLVAAEKAYINYSFLAPKGFLRKDSNLKSSYEYIKSDLKKITESTFVPISKEIVILIHSRMNLMEFYEKLALYSTAKNVEIEDLLTDIELLYEKFQEDRQSLENPTSNLVPMFNIVSWECESITNLLKTHESLQKWDFLNSLITLQEAHRKLSEWGNHLQLPESSSKKSNTFLLKSNPSQSILYQWIWKLKATLLSKFSFIFYDVLSQNSNPAFEIRQTCAKLQIDYYSRVQAFHKKNDVSYLCLVYDARGSKLHLNGYEHPCRDGQDPQGLESFPFVLAYPSKPLNHWPNVVMIINEKLQNPNSQYFAFYDSGVQATYFIHRSDPKLFILCIFETKKSEKDSTIFKFLNELAVDLKCGKIFTSLKSGLK